MNSKRGVQRGAVVREECVACFADVIDPRQDNARHDLHELLLIALCTIMTGGKDCSDMALIAARASVLRAIGTMYYSQNVINTIFQRFAFIISLTIHFIVSARGRNAGWKCLEK